MSLNKKADKQKGRDVPAFFHAPGNGLPVADEIAAVYLMPRFEKRLLKRAT
jgi:hypothetical protein